MTTMALQTIVAALLILGFAAETANGTSGRATLRGGVARGNEATTEDALDAYYQSKGGATSLSAVTGEGVASVAGDDSPRFKQQQVELQREGQAEPLAPANPYARDGGVYDAWKRSQEATARRDAVMKQRSPPATPPLERFQSLTSLIQEDPKGEQQQQGDDAEEKSGGDEQEQGGEDDPQEQSGEDDQQEQGGDEQQKKENEQDASDTENSEAEGEQDAIAQAETRVEEARASANTTHEALVGTQLAIKDMLRVGTSNIDSAHEAGAASADLISSLQKANEAAERAAKLHEQLKEHKARDKAAQAALKAAEEALDALKKQSQEAAAMKADEAQKSAQHEKDKLAAATIPVSEKNIDAVIGMGAASGLGPDKELLSPRQRLFKELGERLLRLATPHKKRIDVVDMLDDRIETLKQKVNVTETERKILKSKLAELEAANAEKMKAKKMEQQGHGSVLQYVSEQLAQVNDAVQRMAPLAQRIAKEEAAKKGQNEDKGEEQVEGASADAEKGMEAAPTSLLEKVSEGRLAVENGEDPSPGEDGADVAEGVRPRTVADLSRAISEDTSSSGSDSEIFATVVKTPPLNDGDVSESSESAESPELPGSSTTSSEKAPLEPIDPTAPGQKSVADQVFDALGGAEVFDEAEKEDEPGTSQNHGESHLNMKTWKGNAESGNADAPPFTKKESGVAAVSGNRGKAANGHQSNKADDKNEAKDEVVGVKLSTNHREGSFGPDEELVARQEIVGATVDAKVAKARLEYAQQRQISSQQEEQLKSAEKMMAMQERAVDGKRDNLKKAEDEALVSKSRLESVKETVNTTTGSESGVQSAIVQRLNSATKAREEVVAGRKAMLEAEQSRLREHETLIAQLKKSINQTQEKLESLKMARDKAVKSQQVVAEKTADTEARYGLRHDVQKLIEENDPSVGALGGGYSAISEDARVRAHALTESTDKDDGEVSKTLAKEGKTFADAAKWRLDQVRTGMAGPIRVPSEPTEHELAAAVGAVVGAERGAQLSATHGIGAAAAAMSKAGADRHNPVAQSFIEKSANHRAKSGLNQAKIYKRLSTDLEDSQSSLSKTDSLSSASSDADRSRLSTSSVAQVLSKRSGKANGRESSATMRFREKMNAETKMTVSSLLDQAVMHSKKSSQSLDLAKSLRKQALGIAQHSKLALDTGLTGLTEIKSPVSEHVRSDSAKANSMFSNLPAIEGDELFENTRKWLQGKGEALDSSSLPVDSHSEPIHSRLGLGFQPPRFQAIESSLVTAERQRPLNTILSKLKTDDVLALHSGPASEPWRSPLGLPQEGMSMPDTQQNMMPLIPFDLSAPLPDLLA